MRKALFSLTLLLLLVCLAACGAKTPAAVPDEPGSAPAALSEADCTLTVSGVELRMGMDFLPFAETLGEPQIEEGQACLSGGYDTNYYYNGGETTVFTLADNGKQLIYDVYTASAEVSSARGIRIGVSSREDVLAAYGEATKTLPTALRYTLADGTRTLAFEFSGETVSAIAVTDDTKNG